MEELFPIVFEMKQLKKQYYQFLGYLVLILFVGFLAFGFLEEGPLLVIGGAKAYFLMALVLGVGIVQSRSAKKALTELKAVENPSDMFKLYCRYYNRQQWIGLSSIALTVLLFVLTYKNTFVYLLILELGLYLFRFPQRELIRRELSGREIIFQ